MEVILVEVISVWIIVRNSVTKLTKSAPEITSPTLPRLPPVTSVIFVEILVRA